MVYSLLKTEPSEKSCASAQSRGKCVIRNPFPKDILLPSAGESSK